MGNLRSMKLAISMHQELLRNIATRSLPTLKKLTQLKETCFLSIEGYQQSYPEASAELFAFKDALEQFEKAYSYVGFSLLTKFVTSLTASPATKEAADCCYDFRLFKTMHENLLENQHNPLNIHKRALLAFNNITKDSPSTPDKQSDFLKKNLPLLTKSLLLAAEATLASASHSPSDYLDDKLQNVPHFMQAKEIQREINQNNADDIVQRFHEFISYKLEELNFNDTFLLENRNALVNKKDPLTPDKRFLAALNKLDPFVRKSKQRFDFNVTESTNMADLYQQYEKDCQEIKLVGVDLDMIEATIHNAIILYEQISKNPSEADREQELQLLIRSLNLAVTAAYHPESLLKNKNIKESTAIFDEIKKRTEADTATNKSTYRSARAWSIFKITLISLTVVAVIAASLTGIFLASLAAGIIVVSIAALIGMALGKVIQPDYSESEHKRKFETNKKNIQNRSQFYNDINKIVSKTTNKKIESPDTPPKPHSRKK